MPFVADWLETLAVDLLEERFLLSIGMVPLSRVSTGMAALNGEEPG